ncbi:MAG TPA: rhodanese-like domain-containing protein, partial [Vicinamibacterales bacterium]|nr:rhodanese-like domain-containing protein [Vicinamibacterales bacterium]
GLPNRVAALRNGTIGWTLEGLSLERGQHRQFSNVSSEHVRPAALAACALAARAGAARIDWRQLATWAEEDARTLYRFDVRTPEEFADGHLPGFRSAPGGQLVQETDVFAPVRGARVVVSDDTGVRADMTASWLAQMGWEVAVITLDSVDSVQLVVGAPEPPPTAPDRGRRYKRPYEGTDNPRVAMQAYLDWEYGLVAQLERDGTHGFTVLS